MPSYSCCARRIVTAAEYPSCLAASCCSVLVRNGAGAGRRRSPFSTAVTLKGSLSASATIARARFVLDLGLVAVQLVQPGLEPLAVLLEVGLDGPVLLRHELADLLLPLADQP